MRVEEARGVVGKKLGVGVGEGDGRRPPHRVALVGRRAGQRIDAGGDLAGRHVPRGTLLKKDERTPPKMWPRTLDA